MDLSNIWGVWEIKNSPGVRGLWRKLKLQGRSIRTDKWRMHSEKNLRTGVLMMMDPTVPPSLWKVDATPLSVAWISVLPCPPMYIGPEPLTGTTAHPKTVIPVLSSYCLDLGLGLRLVGIVKGTYTISEKRGTSTSQTHSAPVPRTKKKKVFSIITWFSAWAREESSRLPLYHLCW